MTGFDLARVTPFGSYKEVDAVHKLIRNNWRRVSGEPFDRAVILSHDIHPEGLNVDRLRFVASGCLGLSPRVGHIISVLHGSGKLQLAGDKRSPFLLGEGTHLYLPPGSDGVIEAAPGSEFLQVSSVTPAQARGTRMLLRDEKFIAACASGTQSLRWAFTPQYLSRRIFLHHDPVLLSKSGNPVSWFRTTMFDVAGLPPNEDGEPVFKMSYNSRTEFNVCYDVAGVARVRMSRHPYKKSNQLWGPWYSLDSDSTYHLNEAAGSPEEECLIDEVTNTAQFFRNKHEVYIADGHVTLFCMFDPAATGIENHRPGEYSDYEPLHKLLGTNSYETHKREIAKFDEMVDSLSLAKALGDLNAFHGTPVRDLYLRGKAAQVAIESEITKALASEGKGRDRVLARWMQNVAD